MYHSHIKRQPANLLAKREYILSGISSYFPLGPNLQRSKLLQLYGKFCFAWLSYQQSGNMKQRGLHERPKSKFYSTYISY